MLYLEILGALVLYFIVGLGAWGSYDSENANVTAAIIFFWPVAIVLLLSIALFNGLRRLAK